MIAAIAFVIVAQQQPRRLLPLNPRVHVAPAPGTACLAAKNDSSTPPADASPMVSFQRDSPLMARSEGRRG